jgi:hypothetical protein
VIGGRGGKLVLFGFSLLSIIGRAILVVDVHVVPVTFLLLHLLFAGRMVMHDV